MTSLKASGTEEEFDEREKLLTDICSLTEEAELKKVEETDKVKDADKRKVEEGEEVRNIAMKLLKDKPNETGHSIAKKKKSLTPTDYLDYLKEKSEREFSLKAEELKLAKERLDMEIKESEACRKKDDALLQILLKSLNK